MILSKPTYRWFWPYWGTLVALVLAAVWLGLGRKPIVQDDSDPYDFAFTQLNLRLSQKAMFQLRFKREEALRKQVLTTQSWGWVPGKMQVLENEYPVRVRLKGDFTDHLQGEKWSFRVKLKEGQAWKGMKAFSLQSPATRGFLKEWQFHQVLQREGFLTTQYSFVRLQINSTDWGIYALEEHFGKALVERNGRKEGAILKLDESGYWATRTHDFRKGQRFATDYPVYAGMEILPFQPVTQFAGRESRGNFTVGQNLFFAWKNGLRPVEELFEVDQMARYYALVDVFRGYHCLFSHNIRMYYNPITARLEPIAYDGYDGPDPIVYQYEPFIGYGHNHRSTFGTEWDGLLTAFLESEAFLERYYEYLYQFSSESYWSEMQGLMASDRLVMGHFLRWEFLTYAYDPVYFKEERLEIQDLLNVDANLVTAVELGESKWGLVNRNPVAVQVVGESGKHILPAFDAQLRPDTLPTVLLLDQPWEVRGIWEE